ncbi:MAG: hypothetical protein AB1689_07420, partial [Thermodesulfobacteriota bacterium]
MTLAPCLTLALLLGLPAAAPGHGGDASLRPALDPLPDELRGMRVELHHTIAPQLVLANPTARVVEVLDDRGVAFLRIGPDGVEANVAARAWYQTYAPGMPASAGRGDDTRWRTVLREASFGWFDPRLDPEGTSGAHHGEGGGSAGEGRRWRVPLRVDGQAVLLGGSFQRAAPPRGRWHPRLASPAEIAPGVRVKLLPGRMAGVLLENQGREVVAVLDEAGEPV